MIVLFFRKMACYPRGGELGSGGRLELPVWELLRHAGRGEALRRREREPTHA